MSSKVTYSKWDNCKTVGPQQPGSLSVAWDPCAQCLLTSMTYAHLSNLWQIHTSLPLIWQHFLNLISGPADVLCFDVSQYTLRGSRQAWETEDQGIDEYRATFMPNPLRETWICEVHFKRTQEARWGVLTDQKWYMIHNVHFWIMLKNSLLFEQVMNAGLKMYPAF